MVLVEEDDMHNEQPIYYLRKGLLGSKLCYNHVEKLALATMISMKLLRHYILLQKTIVIAKSNHMNHVLIHHIIGGKYSKWIVILQEFNLEFVIAKSKKSLAFTELLFELPQADEEVMTTDPLPKKSFFLIIISSPWYGYIIFISKPNILA